MEDRGPSQLPCASVELDAAIRRRKMCRNFRDQAVDPSLVDRLIERAVRAPSAGHSQGWSFLVLEGPEQTAPFWRLATDESWLARPTQPGLLRAPVIIVPLAGPRVYLERYSEPDKAGAARRDLKDWAVPYWLVDTAMATMLLLLGATAEGLGALFFALHGDVAALLAHFGVPDGWEPIGAVALGWPAPDQRPSPSAMRGRRKLSDIVHRGAW